MGQYIGVKGKITFESKKDFDAFFKKLSDGGWYDAKKKSFDSESGDCGGKVNKRTKTIDFGEGTHHNIHRILDDLQDISYKGTIICDTNDGEFSMWMHTDGEYIFWDMNDYAMAKGIKKVEDDDEDGMDWDAYNDLLESFENDPHVKSNAVKFIEEE